MKWKIEITREEAIELYIKKYNKKPSEHIKLGNLIDKL